MTYVCNELSSDLQTCVTWVEQSTFLPPLSYADASIIGTAFWLCLATVWGLKVLRVQIFEKN